MSGSNGPVVTFEGTQDLPYDVFFNPNLSEGDVKIVFGEPSAVLPAAGPYPNAGNYSYNGVTYFSGNYSNYIGNPTLSTTKPTTQTVTVGTTLTLYERTEWLQTLGPMTETDNFGVKIGSSSASTTETFGPGNTDDLRVATFDLSFPTVGNFAVEGTAAAVGGTAYGTFLLVDVVPCFRKGTLIETDTGAVAVETLRPGDKVLTMFGNTAPVIWSGHRLVACYKQPQPERVWPVRVAACAFADGQPARDLWLSPDHAIYIEGVLIPIKHLINQRTISQVPAQDIEYWHVELEQHNVLFAEGLPAESYLDTGTRASFEGGASYLELYPDFSRRRPVNSDDGPYPCFARDAGRAWAHDACAPLVESGAVLEEIRTKLALRAGIGVGETPDARQMGILRGFLDEANCEMVSGWAWQPEHPDTPVRLDILADGTIVGEIVANDLRPDVREAGFGDGRSGFRLRWPTPLSPFVSHVIEARRTSDKAKLGHSGQIIGATQRLNDETLRVFAAALSATAAAEDEAGKATLRRFMQSQTDQLLTTCARSSAARDVARDTSKLALFIDQTLPTPDCDSASRAVLDHMRALRQLGYRVAFASGSATTTDDDRTALEAAEIICYLPPAIGSVEEALRRLGPDLALVYLHRVGTASLYSQLVRHYCPQAMLVFSVAELHFVRVARQAALAGRAGLMGESRRLRDRELLAVAMADRVITHSPAEAALLRAEAPHAKVHVVPWSFPTRPRTAPFQQRRGIAFIGGYRHPPNVDAAHWLVEVIMPIVWQQNPDIECLLVGSHMPDELRRIDRAGIVPMGYVPDLGTVFDRVRLTIAPLRYGAGIKGKVLQSLAAGLPCICTSLAAEGLPILLQNCIGDTAADLASLCLRLHGDEGHNAAMAATGLQLVLDEYSTERVDRLMAVAVGRSAASGHGIMPNLLDASAA